MKYTTKLQYALQHLDQPLDGLQDRAYGQTAVPQHMLGGTATSQIPLGTVVSMVPASGNIQVATSGTSIAVAPSPDSKDDGSPF